MRLFRRRVEGESTETALRRTRSELRVAHRRIAAMEADLVAATRRLDEAKHVAERDRTEMSDQIDRLSSTVRLRELEVEQLTAIVARDRERVAAEAAIAAVRAESTRHEGGQEIGGGRY